MLTGLCAIMGQATCEAFSGVKPVRANLSFSLPERTPQKSAAQISPAVVRLITNSPDFLIMSYEYLVGRSEM
jgi:hypothetical protein